ncbi:hypothetical protein M9Y10_015911 [Tritrichomonas musculus]|uniref:Uncharacterized protein n=1 Tax=Tritrichomonas musculus TaxID=1915356 RepID=A0ABR2I5L1_9EUKA
MAFGSFGKRLQDGWNKFTNGVKNVVSKVAPITSKIGEFVEKHGDYLLPGASHIGKIIHNVSDVANKWASGSNSNPKTTEQIASSLPNNSSSPPNFVKFHAE